ncbi:hypothetical protein NAI48_11705, partial [Francisella tularensis subsp. holarctica]|nr:hypothetical protein [Francisella tularensis subsp. holarctica]
KSSSDGRSYQLSEVNDGVTHVTINVDASDKSVNKFDDEVSISMRDMDNNQIDSKEIFIIVPETAMDMMQRKFSFTDDLFA